MEALAFDCLCFELVLLWLLDFLPVGVEQNAPSNEISSSKLPPKDVALEGVGSEVVLVRLLCAAGVPCWLPSGVGIVELGGLVKELSGVLMFEKSKTLSSLSIDARGRF